MDLEKVRRGRNRCFLNDVEPCIKRAWRVPLLNTTWKDQPVRALPLRGTWRLPSGVTRNWETAKFGEEQTLGVCFVTL